MERQENRTPSKDVFSLRMRLSELGGLAEDQLAKALDAVRRRDMPLARDVVERDIELDRLEMEIEEQALRTLAFRQPLAQDLRETIATLKITTTLERVGDLAKNIARRAETFAEIEPPRIEASVLRMGRLAQAQLADSLNAYGAADSAAAMEIWRRDIEIDELFNSVFRELLSTMAQGPNMIAFGTQMMFIAKNLERIGDHTTLIAEMTYYVSVGQPLTDERPKGDSVFGSGLHDHSNALRQSDFS